VWTWGLVISEIVPQYFLITFPHLTGEESMVSGIFDENNRGRMIDVL
jgi:hypothetical protein